MQLVGLRFFEFSMVVRKNTGSGERKQDGWNTEKRHNQSERARVDGSGRKIFKRKIGRTLSEGDTCSVPTLRGTYGTDHSLPNCLPGTTFWSRRRKNGNYFPVYILSIGSVWFLKAAKYFSLQNIVNLANRSDPWKGCLYLKMTCRTLKRSGFEGLGLNGKLLSTEIWRKKTRVLLALFSFSLFLK